MEEIWRDVVILDGKSETDTYKGKYQVSNLGNVKSLNYNNTNEEKLLIPNLDKKGYLRVWLCRDNNRKEYKIHRLVGFAFLGDSFFEDAQIDHINTIRTDNKVDNLRWVTNAENCNNELTRKHNSKANSGENHHFYGKHHSDESKQKISKANKGRKHSDETKRKLSKAKSGENHPQARAVICITTGEVFVTIEEGAKFYGMKSSSNITSCCKGKRNYCGKHPITKEPLKWAYLDEYTQNNEDTEQL